ncbi:MAG TPA: hypothetical protein VFI41_05390 [Gemmatimonadales bacterium]|nr:hypothetical protein [Gemmatimonadales bacterium]
MSASVQAELDDTVHDTVGDRTVQQVNEQGDVVYVEPEAKTIRVNTTIEDMVFGIGNTYTFEEGRQYRVPAHLAEHLEELGYVWH